MSPIRRYLRITRFSILECRIYLDEPSDAPWLLSSRDPVLERIIQEVRPKVLPKLREENENAKKKTSKKKRGIKDVVSQDDFEVTIFLTETSTRHSLLTKQKRLSGKPRLKSTANKLTSWLNNSEHPIHVEDEAALQVLQEEDDDVVALDDIPEVSKKDGKRKAVDEDDEDGLFVSSSDEETFQTQRERAPKRQRRRNRGDVNKPIDEDATDKNDDKKKLGLKTSYDGFSIYGRILCLVVKRKGRATAAHVGGSQMMEQWVSTQAAQDAGLVDDEDG